MIRGLLARPLMRRALAAMLLFGSATGSVVFWNGGAFDLVQFAINLFVAGAGLVWLHLRWRVRERRALTTGEVEDIFS